MKIYIENFNGVLDELVKHFEATNEITHTWIDADTVVLWQDVMGTLSDVALICKNQGKRTFVVEHGLLSINDYIPPLSKSLTADYFLAWGQRTKDWLVRTGIDSERVLVTGTLLKNKVVPKVKGKNRVLFAPRHWSGELQENLDIANILRTLPYTVRSKIVLGEHVAENYPNPIATDRNIDGHIEQCFDAIANSDVVVGVGEGTFAALCYMMDTPYISVDIWKPKVLLGKLYTKEGWDEQISDACYKPTLEELPNTIKNVLAKDTLKAERKKFREYALNWNKDPMQEFLKIL